MNKEKELDFYQLTSHNSVLDDTNVKSDVMKIFGKSPNVIIWLREGGMLTKLAKKKDGRVVFVAQDCPFDITVDKYEPEKADA